MNMGFIRWAWKKSFERTLTLFFVKFVLISFRDTNCEGRTQARISALQLSENGNMSALYQASCTYR